MSEASFDLYSIGATTRRHPYGVDDPLQLWKTRGQVYSAPIFVTAIFVFLLDALIQICSNCSSAALVHIGMHLEAGFMGYRGMDAE